MTKEEIEFLQNNYHKMSIKELTKELNKCLGKNRHYGTIKTFCRVKLGLNKNGNLYTKEELEWLKNNTQVLSREECTKQFNKKFNKNKSKESLKVTCLRYGYKFHPTKGRYNYNKSISHPIGHEFIHRGYVYIKYKNDYGQNNFMPKHRYVWEQHYGPIPKGKVIIFYDGDQSNCDINNLKLVDANIASNLAGVHHFYGHGKEITDAAIALIETKLLINNMEEK